MSVTSELGFALFIRDPRKPAYNTGASSPRNISSGTSTLITRRFSIGSSVTDILLRFRIDDYTLFCSDTCHLLLISDISVPLATSACVLLFIQVDLV